MQKAILCFRDYQGKDLISGISNGQNVTSHANLNGANDFNGRGASDRVDLLAPYDCIVKSISRADNTVLFESLDTVETPSGYNKCWFLACHMLDKDYTKLGIEIGKTFKQGEPCYTEGNKNAYGASMGNHIHLEQGIGRWNGASSPYYKSNDTYVYNGVRYNTYYPNIEGYECPITDMFFLPDGVEVVQSQSTVAREYKWKFTSDTGDKEMVFEDGYQVQTWNGVKAHVYKLKDGQKLGLMSAVVPGKENWQAVATIKNIDNDKIHYCKINANRFVMSNGEHIGVEQSFENDFAPKQKEFIALWYKNKEFAYTDANDYWLSKSDVDFACSPDVVLMKDGQVKKYIAKGVESTRLSQKTQQSLLIVLKDGSIVLAVTEAISLNDVVDVLKDVAKDLYAFDGGGSAQMVVNGEAKQYTGRAISCVLTAYKDSIDEPQEEPEVPDVPSIEQLQKELEEKNNQLVKLESENIELENLNNELQAKINKALEVLGG